MLTTTGLNFGVRRGIPHLLGICVGFPVMLALIGLGFATLFQLYPVLHEAIKIAGIIYLLYLAWKIAASSGGVGEVSQSKPINFWQAAAFQWINPKAWVMGSSALAAYTTLDDSFFLQVLIICITFTLITLPCAGIWLVFGAGLQHFLKKPGASENIQPRHGPVTDRVDNAGSLGNAALEIGKLSHQYYERIST